MIKLKELIKEYGLKDMTWNRPKPLNEAPDELAELVREFSRLGKLFKKYAHTRSRDLDSGGNRLVGKALKNYNTFFASFKAMYQRIT
jgi:hypothetical protein